MRQELSKAWKMQNYGMGKTGQMVFSIIFFVLGTIVNLFPVFQSNAMDVGTVFLMCAAMFPAQLVLSTDMAQMVQASPYKKRLQTSMPVRISLACTLAMFGWAVFLQVMSSKIQQTAFSQQGLHILLIGIWAFIMMVFSGVAYKFFLAALLVVYVLMFAAGFGIGINYEAFEHAAIHPLAAILADLVLIFAGALIQYGLQKLLYKFPLSKYAFGSGMKKEIS